MRQTVFALIAAAALVVGFGTVAAQAQPRVHILHEVPDDGYTFAGNPTFYGWVLLADDGTPNTHKNGKIRVSQNGALLYETKGGASGMETAHDYDALNSFMFAFPRTGPYEIFTEVPAAAGLSVNSTFTGFVGAPENPVVADIDTKDFPKNAQTGVPVTFKFFLEDESKELLPHTDALFEVRRAEDNWLLFRTHTHTHTEAMSVDYAFAAEGEYLVRLVGYQAFPGKTGASFEPFAKLHRIAVTGLPPINADARAAPASPSSEPDSEDDKEYQLLVTYDPAPTGTSSPNVGPFGNVRLNVLVYDPAEKALVPHVNFDAHLYDALMNTRFQSASLHEYDGQLEVVDQEGVPGTYTLDVKASKGDWSASRTLQFTVTPLATPPNSAGPTIITATGLEGLKAGVPQDITFTAANLGGRPHSHSEIEIQVLRGDAAGPPILINKLHTHGDGKFTATITFPDAGDYTLLLDPETVHGDPTPAYYWQEVGRAPVVALKVAEGVALPNIPSLDAIPAEAPAAGGEAPLPLLVAAASLGLAVLVRRLRREA